MKSNFFYPVLIIITILGFLVFVSKVQTRVFPYSSKIRLDTFLKNTSDNKKIDAREFWQFREFYSPGSFIFEEKGLPKTIADKTLRMLQIKLDTKPYMYPFLVFKSNKLNSIEALTDEKYLERVIVNFDELNRKNCIIDQKSSYICRYADNSILLMFIKPMDEMRRTNGFFDYKRKDLDELTKGRYWLVISKIY